MNLIGLAMWCIKCGAPPECTISIERNGVIAHYGACLAHVHAVADRMLADVAAPSMPGGAQLEPPAGRLAAVELEAGA